MFTKVLIANRGEIAVRIARACAEAGLASVAVYSPEDRDAMHVRLADEAYALPAAAAAPASAAAAGGAGQPHPPAAGYLDAEGIVGLALRAGAGAVHPGYGFLAESAAFARAVARAGLVWVGPPPAALDQVSNKVSARQLARQAGAPLVPATDGPVASAADVRRFASRHGYPVVVKAAYGGGGRGMRVVRGPSEAGAALEACQREAAASFGGAECFAERYLERPRHVETQCLADAHGAIAIVGTRDCTIQRRHQKLVEEAPAPFLAPAQERALARASRAVLHAAGYVGAATCEFLLTAQGECYFMEVNPRLQVEHPVTEAVTGLDLVGEQLRIAAGQALGGGDLPARGHAIEFRLNAEDPARGFLPSPGLVTRLQLPGGPGLRCDFGYQAGDYLTGAFDSLLGKVIVWGRDRAQALARARRALAELAVEGVATVLDLHRAVVGAPDFAAPSAAAFRVHTTWLEHEMADAVAALPSPAPAPAAAAKAGPATSTVVVEVDGKRLEVVLPASLGGHLGGHLGGGAAAAQADLGPGGAPGGPGWPGGGPRRALKRAVGSPVGASAGGAVTAPMQGSVVRVAVADGDQVAAGDLLVVLEAMKMEQPLTAPHAGRVRRLAAAPGDRVATGATLCVVEPSQP
ncbi:MAG: ATP-grasp domain-containing protein [Bifidobacteriaceae bacterium]|nr:ATP-grasp domain-containing protein [Bifidobacteriaceae bacterium]